MVDMVDAPVAAGSQCRRTRATALLGVKPIRASAPGTGDAGACRSTLVIVQVRVLGTIDVVDDDGKVVDIGSPKQRVVLAVVASRAPRAVPAEVIVDQVWGDDPPRTALASLRTYVSRLRRVLGAHLTGSPAGYWLDGPGVELDSAAFEELVGEAATQPPAEALPVVERALALWRGRPFADIGDLDALRGTTVRFEELHRSALELRAAGLLATGRVEEATAAAEQLVADAPFREGVWATLVAALTTAGRTAEALRAYQRAVEVLAEAGLEPGDALRRAEANALAGDLSGPVPGRLPAPLSSLVGRDADLVHLDRQLADARLVTLTGPGGVGKTRLAVETARRRAERHEMGARFVDLADVRSGDALVGAVVDALGLVVEQASLDTVVARAGALDVLVVLDNCEHLVDAAAAAVERLLGGGRSARVLATSRERLGVEGEHVWVVAPLSPDASGTARRLFVDRARAARADLAVTQEDDAAIDRVVRRLDGLPLAIEMAAARVTTLPLGELADRLDDALDVLHSARRGTEPRHQTLSAVVTWSEQLLGSEERRLYEDLSVFAQSATTDDVAAVTGFDQPLDVLARLADRSLLVADTSAQRARFGMLSTIRSHAASRLEASGRAADIRRRHAEHYRDVARDADAGLRGEGELAAHQRLSADMDELRLAARWSSVHDPGLAAGLCAGLVLFAQSRLRDEPLRWAGEMLAIVDESTAGAGWVYGTVALRTMRLGDLAGAAALAERAVELSRRPLELAAALEVLGDLETMRGNLDRALEWARRLLDAGEHSGDPHMITAGRASVGLIEAYAGRRDAAMAAIEAADPPPAPSDQAWLAYCAGEIVLDRDPAAALVSLDRAVELADSVENRYVGGVARVASSSLRARAGEPADALPAFAAVIDHWRRQGDRIFQLTTLRNLVVLLQRSGAAEHAAELLGTVRRPDLVPTFGDEERRLDAAHEWVIGELGRGEAERRAAAGARCTIDDAAVLALTWLEDLAGPRMAAEPAPSGAPGRT
jgi:predicted ATPase/DNA-binding SARP family transcriptional activator